MSETLWTILLGASAFVVGAFAGRTWLFAELLQEREKKL